MGASGINLNDYWISPDAYSHLFGELKPTEQVYSMINEPEMVIQASGRIGLDGSVQLEPWYAFSGTAPAQITGTYTIEALDDF